MTVIPKSNLSLWGLVVSALRAHLLLLAAPGAGAASHRRSIHSFSFFVEERFDKLLLPGLLLLYGLFFKAFVALRIVLPGPKIEP